MINPVINLYRTIDEAMTFRNSPINQFYKFGGVQLLPNNPKKYTQVTNTTNGINLEDWVVKVKNICETREEDISHFFAINTITNSLNGDPQIVWSLVNLPYDFGNELVYLQITQMFGETFYSTPFLLTQVNSDRVTQLHYKSKTSELYQSIGFKTWFRQEQEKIDLTTYYETSTQHTVTQAIKVNNISVYKTELMSLMELKHLTRILRSPYLYVNFIRSSLFEAPSFPAMVGDENFGMIDYQLSQKETDKYNI